MTRLSPTASPAASDDEGEDVILDGATEEEAPEEKSAEISELKQMVTDQAVLIEEMAAKIKELTTEKQMPEQEIEVDEEQKETETKSITLQEYLNRK